VFKGDAFMTVRNLSRAIRILLLAALVLLPSLPAYASPSVVDELRILWTSFWRDSGASIDPDGRMRSAQGREGITIDPDGRANGGVPPAPIAGTDEGMLIDPHG
jgi:hypothetical protein